MRPISQPVTRKDHLEKTAGKALYTADLPPRGVLTARLVRAEKANAEILSVDCPPLPDGYYKADGRALPRNEAAVHANELDMPVFTDRRTGYVGEAVAIIAGPDRQTVLRLARETVITYGDQPPPVLMVDEAVEFHPDYHLEKGDTDALFAQADFIHEETFRTGRQEQAYLETQALEADDDDGVLTVRGSMQCPYYIASALMHAFMRDAEHVRVVQEPTGGAFGGKEEYPSLIACQLAAVAVTSGKPCRLVMDRREDIGVTTKRHPSRIKLRAAVKDGRVTALDADIVLDGGAYRGLSEVVLQRSLFCITGVYNIEHLRARARVARTHTVPNGAFRGFGAPQSFFAIESLMNHIAERLGEDPADFKRAHLARQGDRTATSGVYHERVPLPGMLDQALAMSGYTEKRARFAAQAGRYARGIGVSLAFHGCGFTGNGERDIIRAKVRLEKSADGMVTLLAANTEMGQGLRTTFPKIVANALGLPLSRVSYGLPDTLTAPNSGPTVASRSIMIVGRLFERAAMRLKEAWRDGEAQAIEEVYVDPPHRLAFDAETFTGDAYPAFSWAVNIAEVEIDTRTGQPRVTGIWAVFDCGTPIDLNVLRGQAEGGIVQGLGYGGYEHMTVNSGGAVVQSSFTDYIIPTAADAPPIEVAFYDDPYDEGPSGARGAGELTLVAAAPAFAAAVENAIGRQAAALPLRAESILALRQEVRHA